LAYIIAKDYVLPVCAARDLVARYYLFVITLKDSVSARPFS